MKAWVLRSPALIDDRPLDFADVETPTPGDDEVLVQVHVCGVCRTDLHVVEGDLPSRLPGVIPGHQIVGEIVEAGANVKSVKRRDRVGNVSLRPDRRRRGVDNRWEGQVF